MKAKISSALLVLFTVAFSTSCIEEIDLFDSGETPLIISGEITTEPGPHSIRIYYLAGYNERTNYDQLAGSIVDVEDEDGNKVLLTYSSVGNFNTPEGWMAEVGKSYRLNIQVDDDNVYQSGFERVNPASPVSEVSYEVNPSDISFRVSYSDNEAQENFYRWRFTGTYEVFAPFADPGGQFIPRGQCYPADVASNRIETCWVRSSDLEFLRIGNDEFSNGFEVSDLEIYSVPIDFKFQFGYWGEIKQYSLTEEAHGFWSAISDQLGNTGTIFETSNYQIKGNVESITNPEELVLGYFGASDVSSSGVFVPDFLGTFPEMACETNNAGCRPVQCISCLTYGLNTTKDKPEFWPR